MPNGAVLWRTGETPLRAFLLFAFRLEKRNIIVIGMIKETE
jgi:hypothetical protein